ncbi:MAG TPA: hypothetical protein VFC19_43170 [Candidatus Limnocylindrales bacterium]|nr:hypothetical protein [Candidatus Limnocylindrales bacterium]
MRILRFGVTGPNADPVFGGVDEQLFAGLAAGAAQGAVVADAAWLRPTLEQQLWFGELAPQAYVDLSDPAAAGWTFVVAANDPDRDSWIAAIEPLARHRRMAEPGKPLEFPADAGDIGSWLDKTYLGSDVTTRPKYVLLVGGPGYLPFSLQVQWAAAGASIGRVAFAGPDETSSYVDKVLRLEKAPDPAPAAHAVVFAPDYGPSDPTYYSRRFMAEPIAARVASNAPFSATLIAGPEATKDRLLDALTGTSPALVYTASHGYEVPRALGLATQRRLNGAIACARIGSLDGMLLRGEDVPSDDVACAEGALFFQFACWGYGTPRRSTSDHWVGGGEDDNADEDFIAALATRLLAHPRGPVAFVGHLDTAWLHGFDDPTAPVPQLGQLYHRRLEPFMTAVDQALLSRFPAALALDDLTGRTALLSVSLANFFNNLRSTGRTVDDLNPTERQVLADSFIRRNDAMNFLLLGDPAARVRVETPGK